MQYEVNKLVRDEFGRINGIIAVDKPAGITSHDVVYEVRKALKTKKVGHAGALDPFATGLIIVLVGKATSLSDSYLNLNKEYVAEVLFGISTNSADIEGTITKITNATDVPELSATLEKFKPEYTQYVPVFSSVKVKGEKLRVLAREYQNFHIEDREGTKFVKFYNDPTEHMQEVELPKHLCKIPEIELQELKLTNIADTEFYTKNKEFIGSKSEFPTGTIRVLCSKGTYIRTLAEDIGQALPSPLPAMLINLRRTKIGDLDISNAVRIEQLSSL